MNPEALTRYQELQLKEGESVYIVPRQLRIFVAEDEGPAVAAKKEGLT